MAGAFVYSIDFDSTETNLELTVNILFFGTGLKDRSLTTITVLPLDTLAQIKTRLVDAIIAEATSLGYSVSASNIILPAFQKGA